MFDNKSTETRKFYNICMVEVDKLENSLEIKVNVQFIGQHFFHSVYNAE